MALLSELQRPLDRISLGCAGQHHMGRGVDRLWGKWANPLNFKLFHGQFSSVLKLFSCVLVAE
jgi:hypothetical protein